MIYVGCAKDEETGLYVTPDGEILKPIKQWDDKDGYKYVTWMKKNLPVHRLVARNFVKGRTEKKNVVMHKDDTPSNNKAENLEWGTYSKNILDAYSHGLRTNNVMILCVETGETFPSAREAARKMFGIPKRGDHIIQVARSQRPKAYGFHWEVVNR